MRMEVQNFNNAAKKKDHDNVTLMTYVFFD